MFVFVVFNVHCNILNSGNDLLQFICLHAQVLVVDLDAGSLLYKVGDEARIIPKKIQVALTGSLKPEEHGNEPTYPITSNFYGYGINKKRIITVLSLN